MPEDVGGQPFPDGEEPDDGHHGDAEDAFAAVVFDEDFVRAAEVHEPTAAERILAAAQSHPDGEPPHPYEEGHGYGPGGEQGGEPGDGRFGGPPFGGYDEGWGTTHGYGYGPGHAYGPYAYDPGLPDGLDDDDPARPYRGHARWQRPIAWVLAVVMGVGMVALAFTAVYRGASGQRDEPAPPPTTTTGVEEPPTDRQPAPGSLPGRSPGAAVPTAATEARQG
ncbi:hypothetical protein [Streptomyces sp. JJ36]|uniref:SCO2584 family spore wall biosynthesis protein n=1 Tax=Streptomyces sp. JJ36 TaxID=2736645 RepID=UPI001F3B5BF3|nr:hypothetical protein [Streptomyces sp. JJ36]MCF6521672.1 hypothetical protein [Streptomyces sp. JJ36]